MVENKKKLNSFNFSKKKIINYVLSLTYLSVFGALMIPYNFPLFPIFILLNLGLVFTNFKNLNFICFRSYMLFFYLIYLMVYFLSITFYSFDLFHFFLPDIRNAITGSLLLILSIILIKDFNHFKEIIEILFKQLFLVSIIVSITGLTKFFLSLNGVFIEFFKTSEGLYPLGTSLLNDYNIFSFGLFFGLLIGTSFLYKKISAFKRFLLWISVSTIFITIALTGSRRSLIILIVYLIVFLFKEIGGYKKLFFEQMKLGVVKLNFFRPLIFLFFAIILSTYYFSNNRFEFSDLNQFEKILVRAESLNESGGSFSQRTRRWELSLEILNSMDLGNLLFGKGYQYWIDFAPYDRQNIGTDYPHNLFISTYFSNGIIGLLLISILLIQAFIVYIKNIKLLTPFFIGFLISFIYLFISGDQFFSNKAIVLLIYFPIIIEIKSNGKT